MPQCFLFVVLALNRNYIGVDAWRCVHATLDPPLVLLGLCACHLSVLGPPGACRLSLPPPRAWPTGQGGCDEPLEVEYAKMAFYGYRLRVHLHAGMKRVH